MFVFSLFSQGEQQQPFTKATVVLKQLFTELRKTWRKHRLESGNSVHQAHRYSNRVWSIVEGLVSCKSQVGRKQWSCLVAFNLCPFVCILQYTLVIAVLSFGLISSVWFTLFCKVLANLSYYLNNKLLAVLLVLLVHMQINYFHNFIQIDS